MSSVASRPGVGRHRAPRTHRGPNLFRAYPAPADREMQYGRAWGAVADPFTAEPDHSNPLAGTVHRKKPAAKAAGGIAVDSVALIGTSVLTAGTGLVFWALAARLIPPHELGIQTALLSLVTTAGTIAAVGVGNAFTALLPSRNCAQRDRLRDGYLIVAGLALVFGVGAGLLGIRSLAGVPVVQVVVLVLIGCLAMGFFAVKDSAMIGLGHARRLPVQNLIVSLVKLALLPLCAYLIPYPAVFATVLPSGVAAVVVCAFIIPTVLRQPRLQEQAADARSAPARKDIAMFALRDGTAGTMSLGLVMALPFITTWIAGPVEGAMFALALALSQGLDFVSVGVGTAMTTDLSRSTAVAAARVRKAWFLCAMVVASGASFVIFTSPVLLIVFGTQYDKDQLGAILAVLVCGSVARVSYVMWTALLRAERRTGTLLKVNSAVTLVTLPLILVFTAQWDALGAAAGLALGSFILGTIGAVALVRAGRSHSTEMEAAHA